MNPPPTNNRFLSFLSILLQDIAFGLRQLRKSPGFAVVVIGSLALGIGASVAVFSVVRAILLDPFPYKDANRMVHVELTSKTTRGERLLAVNATEFHDIQQLPLVDDVFLMDDKRQALTGDALPVSVDAGYYSSNLFTYMGVPPLLGRVFTPADAPNGNASPVAVLSYLFWKKQYGGRLDILGKRIELDHVPYTVIGVASPRFTWGDSDIYMPGNFNADPHYYMSPFLKLKPGASFAAVAAEIQPLVDSYAKRDPNGYPQNTKVVIQTLTEEAMHGFKAPLLVLFAAVLLLLLIGCANVSILMLARGTARQHEFAVRASIGASRSRIVRQLLTESLMLSFLGAGLGVLAAYKGVDLLAAHMPEYSFPHEASIHVNGTVLLFAVAIALLTGILFGSSPAWQLSRPEPAALMQGSSAKLTGTLRGRHTHRLLIAGQVMLTMLLLAGAGAALRAFMTLYHAPMGFDPDHVFFMAISLPKGGQHTWESLAAAQESYRQTAETAPGVASASVATTWTPPFGGYRGKVLVSSNPNLTDAQAVLGLVSANIFSTLRIPLLQGRFFTPEEDERAAHVALVNRAFVKQYIPGGDALGKSVRSPGLKLDNANLISTAKPDDWLQIVGVVEDARNDGLDRPVQPQVFLPASFVVAPNTFLLIRAKSDPAAAMRAIGTAIHRLNPEIFVLQEHELSWLLDTQAWGRERFLASLFGIFAILALVLSAAGIYSVVSYTVSQRTREFGVRMALGARRANVIRLVLQSSLLTVAAGAAVGVALSLALGKLVATSANATTRDPAMLLAVSGVLFAITALACLYPAWRAASIDPIKAIRTE
jgi:putative ABC transport system permease protein